MMVYLAEIHERGFDGGVGHRAPARGGFQPPGVSRVGWMLRGTTPRVGMQQHPGWAVGIQGAPCRARGGHGPPAVRRGYWLGRGAASRGGHALPCRPQACAPGRVPRAVFWQKNPATGPGLERSILRLRAPCREETRGRLDCRRRPVGNVNANWHFQPWPHQKIPTFEGAAH